jgi:DNA repair exonuclease SbcCD ATPase subunit
MADQNKFINTYIDTSVHALLEQVKTNLQLQTQVKFNEFLLAEKDKIIESLNQNINENVIADDWKKKYEEAEKNYSSAMTKLQHMDTLLSQLSNMKKQIIEKNVEIETLLEKRDNLQKQIKQKYLPANKKVGLNTKSKKKTEFEENQIQQVNPTDDF